MHTQLPVSFSVRSWGPAGSGRVLRHGPEGPSFAWAHLSASDPFPALPSTTVSLKGTGLPLVVGRALFLFVDSATGFNSLLSPLCPCLPTQKNEPRWWMLHFRSFPERYFIFLSINEICVHWLWFYVDIWRLFCLSFNGGWGLIYYLMPYFSLSLLY